MEGKNNIEDFIRKSADNLVSEYQDDWNVFDQKLSQAVYARRIRRAMAMGAASVVLIFLFMGTNAYQLLNRSDFYVPRTEPVVFEAPTEVSNSNESNQGFIAATDQKDEIQPKSKAKPSPKTKASSEDSRPASSIAEATLASTQDNQAASQGISSLAGYGFLNPEPQDASQVLAQANTSDIDNSEALLDENIVYQEAVVLNNSKGLGFFDHSEDEHKSINKNEKYLYFNVLGLAGDNSNYVSSLGLRPPTQTFNFDNESSTYISPLQEVSSWSYSLNVYPNFTFRKFELDEDKANLLHTDFADAVQSAESGGFSLNIGLEVSKRIGAVTYLNSGIEYISYKTEVLYNFTNFREAIINKNNGFIDGYTLKDKAERISFSDNNIYHYVNFPLSISYQPWASDHVRMNIEAGGSFLYFLTANGQTLDYQTLDIIDLSERDFKNSIGSLSFKVGVNYYVSQRLNIGFEPTLMYFTNTIYNDDYPFYVIPYSVGMNFNLQVKLN